MMFDLNSFKYKIIAENDCSDSLVDYIVNGNELKLYLTATDDRVKFIELEWNFESYDGLYVLGDAWERSYADLEFKEVPDFKWDSKAKVKAGILPGKGWYAEIILPRSSMRKAAPEGMLAEFARYRVLKDVKVKTPYYAWSPFARKFGDVNRFGSLLFKEKKIVNAVKNADMIPSQMKGSWLVPKGTYQDKEIFVTAGNAIRLTGGVEPSAYLFQRLNQLKPDTVYEVSFFAKMDKVKKLAAKSSGFYLRLDYGTKKPTYFPNWPIQLEGSCPWTGFSFKVRTPKDLNPAKSYINFILRKASGTVWLDHIQIRELKGK